MMNQAPDSPASFFNPTGLEIPVSESDLLKLFDRVCKGEQAKFSLLETVFVDDAEIQRINYEFLQRVYVTDTISFRYNEDSGRSEIEGTHYLCIPRILEQASEYGVDESEELKRVFVHGLLHIIGYDDEDVQAKQAMHELENRYLGLQD
jgi:rRNA maturation RNase YbeY